MNWSSDAGTGTHLVFSPVANRKYNVNNSDIALRIHVKKSRVNR